MRVRRYVNARLSTIAALDSQKRHEVIKTVTFIAVQDDIGHAIAADRFSRSFQDHSVIARLHPRGQLGKKCGIIHRVIHMDQRCAFRGQLLDPR